jgi:hypothetical protein
MDRARGNRTFNKAKSARNKHLGSFTSDRTAKAEGDVGGMRTAAPRRERPIRSRMKREIYKGRVVQACALEAAGGTWQPIISIQLSGGATEIFQAAVDEQYQSKREANTRSTLLAKRLIDDCAT